MSFYQLTPLDPLVFGDGRPLERQKAELWPVPATLAAAINGWLGPAYQGSDVLKQSGLRGPLPGRLWSEGKAPLLYTPAPADLRILSQKGGDPELIRGTFESGANVLWPDGFELPKVYSVPERAGDRKLESPSWPLDMAFSIAWAQGQPTHLSLKKYTFYEESNRIHVGIDPDTRTADPGILFKTSATTMEEGMHWYFEWKPGPDNKGNRGAKAVELAPGVVPLGGEGRNGRLGNAEQSPFPGFPSDWKAPTGSYLRLQLLTPGWFNSNDAPEKSSERPPFLPDWLQKVGNEWVGSPGQGLPVIRLVAMSLGRFRAFSGWDTGKKQPRSVRRLVPAGAVYWFADEKGNGLTPQELESLAANFWFRSIEDKTRASRLGFGLCLPGYTPAPPPSEDKPNE